MSERCSDRVAAALRDRGVQRVYGIPGGETVHLVDSLEAHDIEFIITRHENSAAFMGIGGARYDGNLGVCLTTVGPGACNVTMGAGTATLDFAPLLVMTGELPQKERMYPRKQHIDQRRLFSAVCKGDFEASVEDSGNMCRKAMELALEERPGAVHLSLPADIMAAEAGRETPLSMKATEARVPDLTTMRDIIRRSERPVAIIGAGVVRTKAGSAVRGFLRGNGIPALHTWQGAGVMPFDDPLSMHSIGLPCNRIPLRCIEESDLVITIGFDEQEFQPEIWNQDNGKEVLHFSASVPQNVPCYSPLAAVGDLNVIMEALGKLRGYTGNWAAAIREEYHAHISAEAPEGDGIDPVVAIKALLPHMDDAVLVSDVGAHMLWLAEYMPCQREGSVQISNGMIPMGIGLPAAMGVKFAEPTRHCITVTGDAGLMMCIGELQTAVEHDLPVTVMVWNDAALGLIDTRHEIALEKGPGYRLQRTDIAAVARSMGAEGIVVEKASELGEALKTARHNDVPTVLDMRVDYSRNRCLLE